MHLFDFRTGSGPLLVSMPHVGTHVPPAIAAHFTDHARTLPDTDWNLPRLYDCLDALGASVQAATHSRYVVDLNRPPDNENLYPGQDTTALVPIDTSEKQPIYTGPVPDAAEIDARRTTYWQPYHDHLRTTLDAIRAKHGYALLWEAHSIKSVLPRYFPGRLADLNLGTGGGKSAGAGLGKALLAVGLRSPYSAVLDGRFKGGYITRHFGQPATRIHAVQLELSWATYMDESHPYAFREDLAARLRPVLRETLETYL
ncbi:MAG: N-formylglutamate deformylase, partial [Burkholderiales bacterium]